MITFYLEITCLFFTLYVVWKYITMGVYSRTHRLLPLILGLVALFDFYELTQNVTANIPGADGMIEFLEDLLFVQVSYLLICYLVDYLEIHIYKMVHIFLFAVLASTDFTMFRYMPGAEIYIHCVSQYSKLCMVILAALIVYTIVRCRYSKREMILNGIYSAVILVPVAATAYESIAGISHGINLVLTVEICVFVIFILLITGQLVDTRTVLKDGIFSDSEIPTALFDKDLFFVSANKTAELLFLDVTNRVSGLNIHDKKVQEYIKKLIEDKYDGCEEELLPGRFFTWSITEAYYKKDLRGYIYQLIEITDQKEETRKMELLKMAAEEQAIIKGRFLATSSHDLRSPLHAIIGISDMMLSKNDLSMKNRNLVNHIRTSGTNLLKIVNSILDFSKLESGQMQLAHKRYDILMMLYHISENAVIALKGKPVTFTMEIASRYPGELVGDELKISEMISNIISNSIKFTDAGAILCTIEFDHTDRGMRMKCELKDTGSGIPADKIDSVFEEFTSFASEKSIEGTGLGLFTVAQLAKMMNGDVWVESDGKCGTTIGFTIFQDVEPETEYFDPFIINSNNIKIGRYKKENQVLPSYIYPEARVLMADDMQINRQIFRDLTSKWGFQLFEAADGTEAVELVKENKYDLILLDLRMPQMPGDEAARIIKTITDTPIVLISANIFDDTRVEYEDVGFADFLPKPLKMEEVKKTLERLLPMELAIGYVDEKNISEYEFSEKALTGKYKTYSIFEKELQETIDTVADAFYSDLSLFQTKVHGIKGAAKQLGLDYIGMKSEIMEMAAKAKHKDFIEAGMEDYIESLKDTLVEVVTIKNGIKYQMESMGYGQKVIANASEDHIRELLEKLLKAFENFSMSELESVMGEINNISLDQGQKEIIEKAQDSIDDFEYEEGAELLREYLKNL